MDQTYFSAILTVETAYQAYAKYRKKQLFLEKRQEIYGNYGGIKLYYIMYRVKILIFSSKSLTNGGNGYII